MRGDFNERGNAADDDADDIADADAQTRRIVPQRQWPWAAPLQWQTSLHMTTQNKTMREDDADVNADAIDTANASAFK